MAYAHWPSGPCQSIHVHLVAAGPAARAGAGCSLLLNPAAPLSATGWCHALEPAFRTLAAGTAPSPVPYRCSLAVGPKPARQSLVTPPGLPPPPAAGGRQRRARGPPAPPPAPPAAAPRAALVRPARHWPHSACRGREQVVLAPNSLLSHQSVDAPIDGAVIMGMARLH